MLARRIASSLTTRRFFSTVSSHSAIYASTSTSPYFNLSVEDWLFRKAPPEKPLLLLYRNEPCVIIGRNQNPWKEINFPALQALNVPFLRRRSGGGTVYHDLGNTNFSIHLPRTSFNRHRTAQLVQRALTALRIDAEVNERNDICVAYHHGTMLISTELADLGNVLRNTKDGMVTKGVVSVKSPVHNLQQFSRDVTHSAFMDALITEFTREYDVDPNVQLIHGDDKIHKIDHIRNGIAELQQWEWKYGQTPEFTHILSRKFDWGEMTADICSKNGVVISCSLSASNSSEQIWCEKLAQALVGVNYATLEGINEEVKKLHYSQDKQRDVIKWLTEEM